MKNALLQTIVVPLASAIIGGVIVAGFDYVVRERELDIRTVEVALKILTGKTEPDTEPVRQWGVELLDHYSQKVGVPLSQKAKLALLKNQLQVGTWETSGAFGSGPIGSGPIGR